MAKRVVSLDDVGHRHPVEQQKPGFASLIHSITARIEPTETLSQVVGRLLTLGDRQPLEFGLRSLTVEQALLLELAGDLTLSPNPIAGAAEYWCVGVWDYGRILLTNRPPEQQCYRTVGWLPLDSAISEELRERAATVRAKPSECDIEVLQFLRGLTEQDKRQVLERVHDGIGHIDPVLIYVNDSTFTAFGPYNNLLRKPDAVPERLRHVPVDEWERDEQHFIACFYWLLQAGLRGEEFNGQQLTPATLNAHFDLCRTRIARLLRAAEGEFGGTLADKAVRLAEMRGELSRSWFTYRSVNGLNFNKQEHFAPRSQQTTGIADLPADLREYLETQCGVVVDGFTSLDDLFRSCADTLTLKAGDGDVRHSQGIEALLQRTVESAIEFLRSDVGMTRGIRDIRRWQTALDEKRYAEMCEWPTTDYFCAVFPSKRMSRMLSDKPDHLAKILTACSVRMQFNSWHYMPGHFPAGSVPQGRSFYYPPRMADTAVWVNQHHAGHVMAAVKHSIRAPAPLRYRDQTYYGMVDLRVFRSHGDPYTDEDLFAAMRYAEYLRCIYQALADIIAATGREIVIHAFDKAWFDRYASHVSSTPERAENAFAVL